MSLAWSSQTTNGMPNKEQQKVLGMVGTLWQTRSLGFFMNFYNTGIRWSCHFVLFIGWEQNLRTVV